MKGRRLGFKPSHADNKRAIQLSLAQHAAMSGMPTPAEQLSIATARPKQSRAKPGADGRKLESAVNREIEQAAKQFGNVKLWRNNRGQVMLPNGGRLSYGVGPNGASDFIGYRTLTITQDMVGSVVAQFLCVESKRPGERATDEQARFIAYVEADGGHGGVAHSGNEAIRILGDKSYLPDAEPALQLLPDSE